MDRSEWDALGEKALVLRTCSADMTARNDFLWPTEGHVVCPDWKPIAECGNGLHGLLDGYGDCSLLSSSIDAKWLVCEVMRSECVEIGHKVKFPQAWVLYAGDMATALTKISDWQIKLLLAAAQRGEIKDFASGDYSTAASSGNYSKAASSGYSSKAASSGNSSTAASSGYSSTAASSGNYSTAASSGNSSKAAAKGKDTIAMVAGLYGQAAAGENGCLSLVWYDKSAKRNRVVVGYVGENGIKADTFYCVEDGKLKEVKTT